MAPVVLVTRLLPDPGVSALIGAGLTVRGGTEDRPISRDDLLEGVAGADALVCMLSDRIDAEVLDAGRDLRVIANYAVGFDNIDVIEARRRGIEVTTTPGVLTDATADLAWALLLSAARNLGAGERMVRERRWTGWAPSQLLGRPLKGRVLGIVGMGAIGQAVARRASGFEMSIVYHNRSRLPADIELALEARWVPLDELLLDADFISLHAPLNDQSRHMIDAAAFERMKPDAVLVNTARGALIDEAALVDALRGGLIAAAGLDVYEFEPAISDGLIGLDNVVLAPHLGSGSTEARGDMVRLCSRNVVEVLAGRTAVTPTPA
jgi:glyoxylate reductase